MYTNWWGDRAGSGPLLRLEEDHQFVHSNILTIGQLPRVSTEYRVVSVFEPCVCLFFVPCVSSNFLIFPSFILLFLYSTVQKSAVQYSYWPAPSSIQRGLEWSQSLNRLSVCSMCVCKFSHFSLFHPPLFIQYSTEECSTVLFSFFENLLTRTVGSKLIKMIWNRLLGNWLELSRNE